MPPAKTEKAKQRQIAKEWATFRKRFLFSQVELAEALGVSRRLVQYVETGKGQRPTWRCIPNDETLARFRVLKSKHEAEAA